MLKNLLFAPLILTAACTAELISIAKYTGKHASNCLEASTLTGALVDNKLYTFGGCFRTAYVVDPDNINYYFGSNSHINATNLSQVYDISKDEWSFETKTPLPLKKAGTQVVDKVIYFYDISLESRWQGTDMWKYDTDSKIWTTLSQIPFLWSGALMSCYDGENKVYFAGTMDGHQRNIIHIFDKSKDQWIEPPIFMDKRLEIKQMICNKDHIKFIAKDLKTPEEEEDNHTIWYSSSDDPLIIDETLELFSTSYLDGSTISDNYRFTGNYAGEPIPYLGHWVFLNNVRITESFLYKLNTETHENVTMSILPYDLNRPLITPVNENELLILGGIERFGYRKAHRNNIKHYNHKLIYNPHKHEEL